MSFWAAKVVAAVSLVASGIGCLAAPIGSRGYPLYPESVGRPPLSQVATLIMSPSAVIETLDGREMSGVGRDGVFELLPGCHIVEIKRRAPVGGRYGFISGPFDPKIFVLEMKPGHDYAIVADSVSFAITLVYATEQDPSGARKRTIDPIHPAVAPQACKGPVGVSTVSG